MRTSVLSLVKVPPGTKLYATVHTENRISQSQVKIVTNISLQGEHFEACQNMIGQIDVAKAANKMPAKVDIKNNFNSAVLRFSTGFKTKILSENEYQ